MHFAPPFEPQPKKRTASPLSIFPMTRYFLPLLLALPAFAADQPKESDYYPIQNLPNPDNFVMEVGALELAPDGSIFVADGRASGKRSTRTNP